MRVSALEAALAAVTTAVLLGGCGSSPDQDGATSTSNSPTSDSTTPTSAPNAQPLVIIPANNHVTGTYPTSCVRPPGEDPKLPAASCTPGSIRSDVTQTTITTTICHKGWEKQDNVRAPKDETNTVKAAAITAYRIPAVQRNITELDHLVPLELGGSNDVSNLWPEISDEPGHGYHNTKDQVEDRLNAAVCAGTVTLADAQQAIASNWETAEQHLGLTNNNH